MTGHPFRTLLLGGALLGASLSPGQVFRPRSSIRQAAGSGLAHTNHLIYQGVWRRAHARGVRASPGIGGYYPSDLRVAYHLPSAGGSETIAIVDAYDLPTSLHDFNVFSKQFGLPTEPSSNVTSSSNRVFQVVYAAGNKPTSAGKGDFGAEIALDIEWAHAIAPNAKIVLIEAATNAVSDLLIGVQKAASLADVREVSMSFGASETSDETTLDSFFTAANQVYFAAAGDNANELDYPAASPNVIGVGGTSLNVTAGTFVTESAWEDGGGGPSLYEPRPAYQVGFVSGARRGTPDVASDGDPNTGVAVYDSTPVPQNGVGWLVIGGTSLATPVCAAITNLRGDFAASSIAELQRQYGQYAGTDRFRDIVNGSAGVYAAETGYDFITGLGSLLNTFPTTLYAPNALSATTGTRVGGIPNDVLVADGHDFTLRSDASGSVVVQGTFSAPLGVAGSRDGAGMTIVGMTTATSVSVRLYNFGTGNWDVVATPALGLTNGRASFSIANYAAYFDANGTVRFMITATGSSTFRLGLDGIQLGVTTPS